MGVCEGRERVGAWTAWSKLIEGDEEAGEIWEGRVGKQYAGRRLKGISPRQERWRRHWKYETPTKRQADKCIIGGSNIRSGQQTMLRVTSSVRTSSD